MIGLLSAALLTIGTHLPDVFAPPPRPPLSALDGQAPAGARRLEVAGRDGVMLRGWLVPAARPDPRYVLFFYGSNEDALIERNRLSWLASLGVNAVCLDYRGYGFSDGKVDAAGIREDSLALFDAVRATIAPPGASVLVYGWSIGTQLALHVAAHRPVSGVILQAPPASADDMDAASRAAAVPAIVRWAVSLKSDAAVRSVFQGKAEAAAVTAPMLIIEGRQDTTVPPAQAQAVFDASPSRQKTLVLVDGADHNRLRFQEPPASTALISFLRERQRPADPR